MVMATKKENTQKSSDKQSSDPCWDGYIKKGMKTTEVKALVGDPITKKDMIFVEWWMYNDLKNHIVIIGGDSVVNITTKKEFEEGMKDAFDSILKP